MFGVPIFLLWYKLFAVVIGSKSVSAVGLSRSPGLSLQFANYMKHEFHYLNVTQVGKTTAFHADGCCFECLENPQCFSVNVAASIKHGEQLWCELLSSDKYNNSKDFKGNESSHHYSLLSPCSAEPCKNGATCVANYEDDTYTCLCGPGFDRKRCEKECLSEAALGMQSGAISDAQISASSEWDANHTARQARLHFQASRLKAGSWSSRPNDQNQWLQVDFGGETYVTRIATQGRNAYNQWVTKYKLQYSIDGVSFHYYKDKVFDGNDDSDTIVYHQLNPPIRGRYIRLRAVAWHNHISMRIELYACSACNATDGWQMLNNSCYKYFHEKKTWTEAEQYFEQLNSTLATIHSQEEDAFVASLIPASKISTNEEVFIGANDLKEEGTWVWVDGSDWGGYDNWAAGEPNDNVHAEDCGTIKPNSNFEWNDFSCPLTASFICKTSAKGVGV